MPRPTVNDVRIALGAGYANVAGEGSFYVGAGVDLAIPQSRLREWNVLVGLHGSYLQSLGASQRTALLVGLRLGMGHTWTPSSGGVHAGVFGELGGGYVTGAPRRAIGYDELGGSIGDALAPRGGFITSLSAEAAVGSTTVDLRDAEALRWFRVGFSARFRF